MSYKNILKLAATIVLLSALAGVVANNKFKLFQFVSHLPELFNLKSSKVVAKVSKIEKEITFANNQFGFKPAFLTNWVKA